MIMQNFPHYDKILSITILNTRDNVDYGSIHKHPVSSFPARKSSNQLRIQD